MSFEQLYKCDRCGAPKGEQALGESCNTNCGGKVIAIPNTKYTVIIYDFSVNYNVPEIKALQVEGISPEDAAANAEVVVASEIWHRRYPEVGEPTDQDGAMDDEWIKCMESAGTLAVIQGHSKTWIADEIYVPQED